MEQQEAQMICNIALEIFKAADHHIRRSPSNDDLKCGVQRWRGVDCWVSEGDLAEEKALRESYIRPAMAMLARSVPCGAMFLDTNAEIEIPPKINATIEATAKSEFLTFTLINGIERGLGTDKMLRFDVMILVA